MGGSFINAKTMQINEDIRDAQVRLVGDDGEQLGILSAKEAQKLAIQKGLDLVKIAPQATPPVCKLMDYSKKIKELRESTGMNRKEFCDYFNIPYRTVTEWERDNRHAPEYVIRLLEYYIRTENLIKKKQDEES